MRLRQFIHLPGVVVLLLALMMPVGAALAQDDTPTDDEVNAIARKLYCPVCPNEPLDVCTTQACVQWRGTIRQKLIEGWSEDEIRQYFADQYGDRVLSTPPARGFNWLVYLLPPIVILGGVVVLVRVIRSWRQTPASEEAQASVDVESEDPYVAQLEDELRRRA
jgi:cytochrome c-type biogenesis protein CcmH